MKHNLAPLIESRQNTQFKRWRQLLDSRGIRKQSQFLLMGRKLVPELLQQMPEVFVEVLCADEAQIEGLPAPAHVKSYQLSRDLFAELDEFGTDAALLVGRVPEIEVMDLEQSPQGLEVVCGLGDPANLGALLRSCEAFAADRVILLSESAHPFHPKAIRSSSGSCLRLKLCSGPSIQQLRRVDVGLDMHGGSIYSFDWPKNIRLMLGEEGPGVPESAEIYHRLQIPMSDPTESLNATVAASIALYSYRGQHSI